MGHLKVLRQSAERGRDKHSSTSNMASKMTLACCLPGGTMTIIEIVANGEAFNATMKLVTYKYSIFIVQIDII